MSWVDQTLLEHPRSGTDFLAVNRSLGEGPSADPTLVGELYVKPGFDSTQETSVRECVEFMRTGITSSTHYGNADPSRRQSQTGDVHS